MTAKHLVCITVQPGDGVTIAGRPIAGRLCLPRRSALELALRLELAALSALGRLT